MQEIKVTRDAQTPINIINIERGRDIPGGASLELASLVDGGTIEQATPIAAPTNGIRKVCKQGKVLTGSTTTAINLATGKHHFKVGDFIGTKTGGKAYAVTGITSSNGVDTLAVGTAIDTPTVGGFIYEMAAEAASNTSALKNTPVCISGIAIIVDQTKVIEAIPVYVACSIKANVIGSEYLSLLKNIDAVSY